jgi:hypothetical protein
MKLAAVSGLVLCAVAVATPALADDKAACLDAVSKAQRLRGDHRLVEAREQLRICAAATCPAVVKSDCTTWLVEVEKALPTVVVAAKSDAGADLVDVTVTVDGQPLLSRLDGKAVPMNPGSHAFHFATADRTTLDQTVVVREGEKDRSVSVVLGPTAAAPSTPPSAASGHEAGVSPPNESSPWRTVGWIVGGVGAVGLGVGAVFGSITLADKGNHCTGTTCEPGSSSRIKSEALASDIGWIAGGVLSASGIALVLFSPSGRHEATTLRVGPVVTAGGAGALLAGSW